MKRAVRASLAAVWLAAGAAVPAVAQELTLSIDQGLVTLVARNVSAQQILAEWARVGQTKIVNGDKVPGAPLTLQLDGVPEERALQTVLRAASGYLAAPRPAGQAGTSRFDRILILAASQAPAPTGAVPPTPAAAGRPPMPRGPLPVLQPPMPAVDEVVDDTDTEEFDENPPMPPGVAAVPGMMPPAGNFEGSPGGQLPQVGMPGAVGTDPASPPDDPATPQTSPRPGVIIQPPPPAGATPGQPYPYPRPAPRPPPG